MSSEDSLKEVALIRHIAKVNGYKMHTVDKLISKKLLKKANFYSINDQRGANNRGETIKYICIEFSNTINNTLCRTMADFNLKLAFNTSNCVKNMLQTRKLFEETNQTGIYKLNCADCPRHLYRSNWVLFQPPI